ncbi:aminopeptidase [Egibacter rhizosphaerae]|uniref:Aminopeptidase n=1 Tax=Egibacter rhizosphaerae TaxID=1670831 RepID=A0A411YCS0_9ACTN|nr:M55 family metallopeptidase [Egibacter rhizosphaerae]QBI18999.1 aminopeptidase [Egibacter rhizosphaerae]
MRVHVSIDMEGVAGVATTRQVRRGEADYEPARELMTDEASAVVSGAFEGGADEVVVTDAHGDMSNLLPERLDPRAELVLGSPKVDLAMLEGLDEGANVTLFVGYHGGTDQMGALAHTYSGASFAAVRLDGVTVTEAEINARVAGYLGVPVGLVSGDDTVCDRVAARLPGVRTVCVKRSHASQVVTSLHPDVARGRLREASAEVVAGVDHLAPPDPGGPTAVEVELSSQGGAELCALVPGVERVDARTVRYDASDVLAAFRCLRAWLYLAAAAAR